MVGRSLSFGERDKRKGFLLLDLLLAVFISATISILTAQCMQLFVEGWQKVKSESELQNAATFILNGLDKYVSQEAITVNIQKDAKGVDLLDCTTYKTDKRSEIICEDGLLYVRITSLNGPGKDPLFPAGCVVKNWKIKKADDKTVLVSFSLEYEKCIRSFTQLLVVINGYVYDKR